MTTAYVAQFGDPAVLAPLEAEAQAYHAELGAQAAAADPNSGIVEKLRSRR